MAMSVSSHWETFEEILSGWSVFHVAMLLLFPLYQQWINYPNDGHYRDGSPCECAAMCSHGCDSTASVTGHLGSLRKQKCYLSDKSRRAECDSHCGKRNLMRHLPLWAVWLRGIHHFVSFCFIRRWRSECLNWITHMTRPLRPQYVITHNYIYNPIIILPYPIIVSHKSAYHNCLVNVAIKQDEKRQQQETARGWCRVRIGVNQTVCQTLLGYWYTFI